MNTLLTICLPRPLDFIISLISETYQESMRYVQYVKNPDSGSDCNLLFYFLLHEKPQQSPLRSWKYTVCSLDILNCTRYYFIRPLQRLLKRTCITEFFMTELILLHRRGCFFQQWTDSLIRNRSSGFGEMSVSESFMIA